MKHRIYQPADFKKLPWKNGLGFTTELLRRDLDGDAFAWRLSIAGVEVDGPFSRFDGYDRTLILLSGAGVTLDHAAEGRQRLDRPLAAASFAGEGPTSASLHHGPIEDFNIITRRGVCRAVSHADAESARLEIDSNADHLLIYASAETLTIKIFDEATIALAQGHLLAIDGAGPGACVISGNGAIAVEITRCIAAAPGSGWTNRPG